MDDIIKNTNIRSNLKNKNIQVGPSAEGKIPPQAIDLEEAVLGAIMLDKDAYDDVSGIIDKDHFYKDAHVGIFEAMTNLYRRSSRIDLLTVTEELRKIGKLEQVGGAYYITQLTSRLTSAANIEFHARIIQEKFLAREVIKIAGEMLRNAFDDITDVFELIESSDNKLFNLVNRIDDGNTSIMGDVFLQVIKEIEDFDPTKDTLGIPTGLFELDRLIRGLQAPDLIIIAGRPGMGKTSLALSITEYICTVLCLPMAFYSYEMKRLQLMKKIVSLKYEVPLDKILDKDKAVIQILMEAEKYGAVLNGQLHITDGGNSLNIVALRTHVKKLVKKAGIKVIVVDYIQLIPDAPGNKNANREGDVSQISRGLKLIAMEFNICVIALSQLNRETIKQSGSRPVLSNLRECLSTETSFIYSNNSFQSNTPSRTKILSLTKSNLINMDSNNVPKKKNLVFRLTTGTGRFIDATANHPVLTTDGYKKISQIKGDDSIAIAINWENEKSKYIPEAKFIGWMLGNGCMYGYNVPSFITRDEDISILFNEFLFNRFGFYPKEHPHYKSKVFQWDITNSPSGNRTATGNIVTAWLKENDLWGNKAKDKKIPQWFMEQADEKSICELLQGLIETDGSIAMGKKRQVISYSTTSLYMAHQIMYLFAKVGIVCFIDKGQKSKLSKVPCYKITIHGSDEKANFVDKIKLDGYKGESLKSLPLTERQSYHSNKIGRSTTVEMASMFKSRMIQTHGNRRLTKKSLRELMPKTDKIFKDKYSWLLSDNIFWDTIDSIQEIGVVDVFDREVPKTNNFIVNGIIVHNSGAIEQDADMVWFAHRPEYYGDMIDEDGQSTEGIAEIIIAKHRNGKCKTVKVKWLETFTKFTNLNHYEVKKDMLRNENTNTNIEDDPF